MGGKTSKFETWNSDVWRHVKTCFARVRSRVDTIDGAYEAQMTYFDIQKIFTIEFLNTFFFFFFLQTELDFSDLLHSCVFASIYMIRLFSYFIVRQAINWRKPENDLKFSVICYPPIRQKRIICNEPKMTFFKFSTQFSTNAQ